MRLANIFDSAQLYKLFQFSVISNANKVRIREEVLKPSKVGKVLDFGCGIGYHSIDFSDSVYLGIEPLSNCVEKANKMYKTQNSNFIVGDHSSLNSIPDSSFDVVIAIGVLHHIEDEIFVEFIKEAHRILKPGGRLTTFDPVYHSNQSSLSRWVVARDRGEWVRTSEEYLQPVKDSFQSQVSHNIYQRLLRIPYDHIHMEAIK
jgi:ubiquinone/menaquinone biosynthesis C-methylase UbiE